MNVIGRINYIDRRVPDPTTYYVTPPPGVPVDNVAIEEHMMEVTDLRGLPDRKAPGLDSLSAVHLDDGFAAFDDEDAVKRDLAPAMEAATRTLLGNSEILAWDHAIRRRSPTGGALRGSGTLRQPLLRAHCDYTPGSIGGLMRQRLGDRVTDYEGRPFLIVNFWRAVTGPLRDDPLAICAPNTVATDDLIPIRHVHPHGESEIFGLAYNPAHKWYYMSDMEPGDALFFVQYDSAKPVTACAPHTAFSLPRHGSDMLPRESFEYRLLVFPEITRL